ncbi:hypothetical protein G9A89_003014 [Geosiphon pyriformis]|nr:hypothetical protein G9A89_003014 [Geosiphon pyriformis]
MLQNNSEKAYIIELNKKIAQAIFLPLVKIAQLVLLESKEKLRITAKKIQEFGFTNKIDIPVNMAEEKIDQAQLFKAETIICESEKIGLTNLYIPAKSPKNIKILIYNTIGNVIKISEETIIGYLTTELKRMLSALTRTIGTDELKKFRLTLMDATQEVTQQL